MAGTNKNRKNLTKGPIIILVEPQLPENIGMVARAMANFGLSKLRLVAPRETFPNEKARAAASKADHVINHTVIFDTLREAVADLHYVFATTARERCGFKTVKSAVEAAEILRQHENIGHKTGILFGRERWGLENDEISLVDEIITFPVNPAFASLNIAQAVLLMSYEWMKSGLENVSDTVFRAIEMEPANKETFHGFLSQLEEALDIRGYFRPRERKEVMVANLRSVFTRAHFSESEVRLLRGVISSLDHFSPQLPRGSGAPADRERKKFKKNRKIDG
ncbi:RNA methyltransferase [Bartonella florencae]|uniref:RNA methyltransferase n=1 Tax=Bartonella florencae TaxID=928210 RepID=UPI0003157B7D|nr:RNA methyltransferase [Bartonella florencae]